MKLFINASVRENKTAHSGPSVPLSINYLLSINSIVALKSYSTNGDYQAILRDADLEAIRRKDFPQNSHIEVVLIDAKEVKKLLE